MKAIKASYNQNNLEQKKNKIEGYYSIFQDILEIKQ